MKTIRNLALAAFILSPVAAYSLTQLPSPAFFSISVTGGQITLNGALVTGSVSSTSALKTLPTAFITSVLRLGYASSGDGPPVTYAFSTTNCSVGAGAGDDGSQIKPNTGTGCWIANLKHTQANVLIFGADSSGTVDAATAINAADAAANRLALEVIFPGGAYKTSTCLTPSFNAVWRGINRNISTIKTSNASAGIICGTNPGLTLSDLGFGSTVARTSGSYITVNKQAFHATRLLMNGAFTALQLDTGVNLVVLDDIQADESVTGARVFVINDCFNCHAKNMFAVSTAHTPLVNMLINNAGDFSCIDCDFLLATHNIWLNPGAGQGIYSIKFVSGHADTSTGGNGLYISPNNGGVVARSDFTGMWFGSSGNNNVQITPDSSSTADGITFTNCDAVLAASGAGLSIDGPAKNIIWNGGKIAANLYGAYINNARNITISDTLVGVSSGLNGNNTGILIGGTSDYININSVQQLNGNVTSSIVNVASGTHNRIQNNPGYNPVGSKTITVTSSPFTYTAGPNGETVYVSGGSSVGVSVNGIATGLASGGFTVGPNSSVVVTYTVAPAIKSDVQ